MRNREEEEEKREKNSDTTLSFKKSTASHLLLYNIVEPFHFLQLVFARLAF